MRVPVVVSALVAATVALSACTFAGGPEDIADALGSPTPTIDLAEVVPGTWERAYVFGEYATADTMLGGLIHEYHGRPRDRIRVSDPHGNRESTWIGPARRHALSVRAEARGF